MTEYVARVFIGHTNIIMMINTHINMLYRQVTDLGPTEPYLKSHDKVSLWWRYPKRHRLEWVESIQIFIVWPNKNVL